jgi:hypothetical protein
VELRYWSRRSSRCWRSSSVEHRISSSRRRWSSSVEHRTTEAATPSRGGRRSFGFRRRRRPPCSISCSPPSRRDGQRREVVGAAASGCMFGPRGARSIPLDLEGAGGQRFFRGLLQDTAAARSPTKSLLDPDGVAGCCSQCGWFETWPCRNPMGPTPEYFPEKRRRDPVGDSGAWICAKSHQNVGKRAPTPSALVGAERTSISKQFSTGGGKGREMTLLSRARHPFRP